MRADPPSHARLRIVTAFATAAVFILACSDGDSGTGPASGALGQSGAGGSAAAGGSNGVTGGDAEPAAMAGVTEAHNQVRANVAPPGSPALPPLVWSASLAASAQAYANVCKFEHSKGDYGENLYAGTAVVAGAEVVGAWAGEAVDYDYDANACAKGKACGHYTQIVWRETARVGCAVTTCTVNSPFAKANGGEWQNWVCHYDPPGNYVGEKPY